MNGSPTPPQKCHIVDKDGNFYHATKAPAGFCDCGIMMELLPKQSDYVFKTKVSARHAIAHTLEYLKTIGVPFNPKEYRIENVT